jgi:hypothetical protein
MQSQRYYLWNTDVVFLVQFYPAEKSSWKTGCVVWVWNLGSKATETVKILGEKIFGQNRKREREEVGPIGTRKIC